MLFRSYVAAIGNTRRTLFMVNLYRAMFLPFMRYLFMFFAWNVFEIVHAMNRGMISRLKAHIDNNNLETRDKMNE